MTQNALWASGRAVLFLFIALAALSVWPFFDVHTLPLVDYPNHLARQYILAYGGTGSALDQFYEITWRPLPNLATDLVVPALSRVMPLELAMRGFVALACLMLALGTVSLHRVVSGGWSVWPLLSFTLLHSRFLLWGFVNFLFGVGLALLGFAAWIALSERHRGLAVVVGTVAAIGVYLSHLAAFGALGALILAYEGGMAWRNRRWTPGRWLAAGSIFVLPSLAFLSLPGGAGEAISFSDPIRKLDLPFSLFYTYLPPFDAACLAALVLIFVVGLWRGWLRVAPAMRWPVVAMLGLYVIMPAQIMTASSVDRRMPLIVALVLIAGTGLARVKSKALRIGVALGLAVFMIRIGVLDLRWREFDRHYEVWRAALRQLPEGARVAVATDPDALRILPDQPPLQHFATFAVLERNAFVPTLFAFPTQQPIRFRAPWDAIAAKVDPAALWADFVDPARQSSLEALCGKVDAVVFSGVSAPVVHPPACLREISLPALDRARVRVYLVAAAPKD